MRKLKLFFACLLMAVLSIGQVWADLVNSYTKVTAVNQLSNGDIVVIAQETSNAPSVGVTGGTVQSSTSTKKDATVSNTESQWKQFTVIETTGGWYLSDGTNFVGKPTANTFYLTTTEASKGVCSVDENGVLACNDRYLAQNSSNYRMYGSVGSYTPFYVWKVGTSSVPALSASPATIDFGTVEQNATVASKDVTVTFANLTGSVTYSGLSGAFSASGSIANTGDKISVAADASTVGEYSQTLTVQSTADSKTATVTVKMNVLAPFNGETLEITQSGFAGSYANNEGDSIFGGCLLMNIHDICKSSSSMQFKASSGALYNKTDLGAIARIEITKKSDKSNNLVVYEGTEQEPSTEVSGSVSGDVTTYTFSANKGFFKLSNGSNTTNLLSIKIYYTPAAHAVTLSAGSNGTLSATVDDAAIASGDDVDMCKTVAISATPNSGYKVKSLTVTDADDNEVEVTNNEFIMPAKAVTVAATFEATKTLTGIEITNPATQTTFWQGVPFNYEGLEVTAHFEGAADEVVTPTSVTGSTATAGENLTVTVSYTEGTTETAEYTIDVKAVPSTAEAPYTVAEARNLYDAYAAANLTQPSNVFVKGVVTSASMETSTNSNAAAYKDKAYNVYVKDAGTDGSVLFEFYRMFKDNTSAAFTAGDIVVGDTLIANGTLYKYSSTYEFSAGCYMVDRKAYAAPKVDISNDQEHPYTVAQAIALIDDLSSDLTKTVFVKGVVTSVSGSNIFIKDANAENSFELYSCADVTGVEENDTIIGTGTLKKHNTTYELDNGCEVVEIKKYVAPPVAVESVELASTATVKVGNSINLTASVLPENATNKEITWSVESGAANITFDNGSVTGVEAGEAVVRATSSADANIYAECTITIEAADPTYLYYNYEKVTATADIEDGEYLIVYEAENVAFDGGLEALDAAHNTIAVTIDEGVIASNATTDAAAFTIDVTNGTVRAHMGDYIGVTSYGNGLKQNANVETYPAHSFSINGEGDAVISIYGATWNKGGEGTMILNYNSNANDKRFRYYKEGSQNLIQLYKKVGTNEAPKANPQLAWDPADDIVLTVGDAFTAPSLTYAQGFDGVDDVAIESNNPDLAVVNDGVVSLVADATGEATITATFAGNDNYKAAEVSYKITVNASTPTPLPAAEAKVVVVEYNSKFYAMSTTVKNGTGFEPIQVKKENGKIIVESDEEAAAIQWQIALGASAATFQNGNGKYLACSTESNTALVLLDDASTWDKVEVPAAPATCYKQVGKDDKDRTFYYNYNSGSPIFRAYTVAGIGADGYSGAPEFISADKIEVQVPAPKADAELAFDPEEVSLTLGDDFTAPTLNFADGFDGLVLITYASSKPAVAEVDPATGEVTIKLHGTTTITASFEGNDNYNADAASYIITVNKPAPTPTSTTYTKVTATADITDGEYLIVYEGDNTHASVAFDGALATLDAASNNVAVTISEGVIAGNTEIDAAVFTIDVTAQTLQSASGKFIGVTSNSNGLKQENESAQYFNTFAIDDNGNAVITPVFEGSSMALRYNYGSNDLRFRYYGATSQKNIALYKKDVVVPPTPATPDYTRNVTNGHYGTICLPKAGTIEGATLFEIGSYENGMIYIDEVGTTLTAGVPYIFYASGAQLNVYYTDKTADDVPADDANGLYGFYDLENENATYNIPEDAGNYILYNDQYWEVRGRAAYIANYRAYIKLGSIVPKSAAPGRRRVAMTVNGEQVATGIGELNASETPVKMIIDGQLFIIRGEKMFDATGRLIK